MAATGQRRYGLLCHTVFYFLDNLADKAPSQILMLVDDAACGGFHLIKAGHKFGQELGFGFHSSTPFSLPGYLALCMILPLSTIPWVLARCSINCLRLPTGSGSFLTTT